MCTLPVYECVRGGLRTPRRRTDEASREREREREKREKRKIELRDKRE